MSETKIWPSPKVVVIGGGTGTSTILSGIKKYTDNITAIISVYDNGGSTGRLRKDLDIIATGDLRACLVALSDKKDLLADLLMYRFEDGELKGHNFGNLFIAAMNGITKDFSEAINQTSSLLNITGKVLPITLENANLVAILENGNEIVGETEIPKASHKQNSRIKNIYTQPDNIKMLNEAKEEILEADLVILGPGSLYTSIIPNLLAKDMAYILDKSKAKVVYVVNIMEQMGESEGYSVREHYDAIVNHSRKNLIDYIVVNNKKIPEKIQEKYISEFSKEVIFTEDDRKYLSENRVKIIEDSLYKIENEVVRHDSDKLAAIIFNEVYLKEKFENK